MIQTTGDNYSPFLGEAEMTKEQFYKLARPNGWDFKTGKTINYRENIGKTVTVPTIKKYRKDERTLCSDSVLHASRNINDCFIGASIPCSAFVVEGIPVVDSEDKSGFTKLAVLKEIPQEKLDDLMGWKYSVACNPVHPFKLPIPQVSPMDISLLQEWASIRDSIRASVWDSVWDSIRASVWASIRVSVWDSIRVSIWDSIYPSVWDSIWDSVWAYMGSLFPNIKTWKYAPINIKQGYPYQSAVDLWHRGLVPSFDGKTWRLYAGKRAEVIYQISKEKLMQK